MGGMGSGRRWYTEQKATIEDYRWLDVRYLKRHDLLLPGRSCTINWSRNGIVNGTIKLSAEPDRVILDYRYCRENEKWISMHYPIGLTWTKCNIGGKRPWFLCPAQGCNRRAAILYLGSNIFACRHCYNLSYTSQGETWDERAARRADRIRDKLGWEPGFLNGNGWKPKGMHWNTFERLTTQHDAFVQLSLAGIAERLNLLGESLDD
ncbi:hypothetical protein [Sedimenticola thiotaurini]|uniref:Uncharacterized protein n=1 Tax=Sedimenticola thiotaurini TaxID=1543721 RepID=A0A0F7JTP2_9GAMM|nr:hypothetical protein [Sedimenticola thiotaurini]AKH19901.1 hypothetical protein AAY24_05530 [Sedimenticola thiotaurini]